MWTFLCSGSTVRWISVIATSFWSFNLKSLYTSTTKLVWLHFGSVGLTLIYMLYFFVFLVRYVILIASFWSYWNCTFFDEFGLPSKQWFIFVFLWSLPCWFCGHIIGSAYFPMVCNSAYFLSSCDLDWCFLIPWIWIIGDWLGYLICVDLVYFVWCIWVEDLD